MTKHHQDSRLAAGHAKAYAVDGFHPVAQEVRVLLEPLALLVGEFVTRELRSVGEGRTAPRYYTARNSPLPRKAFLAAARATAFPSFVVKRRVYARCEDVHRFIESSRRPERSMAPGASDEIGRLLEAAELKPRRRR